eukprot:3759641-Rhodomonas_salina.1
MRRHAPSCQRPIVIRPITLSPPSQSGYLSSSPPLSFLLLPPCSRALLPSSWLLLLLLARSRSPCTLKAPPLRFLCFLRFVLVLILVLILVLVLVFILVVILAVGLIASPLRGALAAPTRAHAPTATHVVSTAP